jgi:hypothetical protein
LEFWVVPDCEINSGAQRRLEPAHGQIPPSAGQTGKPIDNPAIFAYIGGEVQVKVPLAEVAEQVDAPDSKSGGPCVRASSILAFGTINHELAAISFDCGFFFFSGVPVGTLGCAIEDA